MSKQKHRWEFEVENNNQLRAQLAVAYAINARLTRDLESANERLQGCDDEIARLIRDLKAKP